MRFGLLLTAMLGLTTGLVAASDGLVPPTGSGKTIIQTIFITEYQIVGTRGLPRLNLSAVVSPYLGPDQNRRKVELVRTALLRAYHDAGITGITVLAPTSPSKTGVIRLQVIAATANRSLGWTSPAPSPIASQTRSLPGSEQTTRVKANQKPVPTDAPSFTRVVKNPPPHISSAPRNTGEILEASPEALQLTGGAKLRRDLTGDDQPRLGRSEQPRLPITLPSDRPASAMTNQAEANFGISAPSRMPPVAPTRFAAVGGAPTIDPLVATSSTAQPATTVAVLPTSTATVSPSTESPAATRPSESIQPLELAKTNVVPAVAPRPIASAPSVISEELNAAEKPTPSSGNSSPGNLVREPERTAQIEVAIHSELPSPFDAEVQPPILRATREREQTKDGTMPMRSASADQKLSANLALKAKVSKRLTEPDRTLGRLETTVLSQTLPARDAMVENHPIGTPNIPPQKAGNSMASPLPGQPMVTDKKTPLPLISGADSPSDKISLLLSNSPFGQMRTSGASGKAASEPLEFRAVLDENNRQLFSLFETSTHRSVWVGLNQAMESWLVTKYDSEAASIIVEYNGSTLTLSLKGAPPRTQTKVTQAAVAVASGSRAPVPGAEYHDRSFRIGHVADEMYIRKVVRKEK